MAVFTETIKLEDQVSPAAKAASGEAKTLGDALDAVNKSLVKASALGNIAGFKKLTKDSAALSTALGQVDASLLAEVSAARLADAAMLNSAKVAAKAEAEKKSLAAAATATATKNATQLSAAMAVGKESVGAAVAGMRAAFTSLAAGDVKGAVQGVTDSIAGMAKLLDLVVPGLGQAVSLVIQIAGGLVGITAGLIKSGVEFAISSSEAKQQMLGLFDAMGGGLTTGAQTEEMIDRLKAKFGISKDSLIGYTNELQRMGMTDLGQIEDSLLAVASAAALVKGGDQALLSFTKKIQLATDAGIGLKIPTKALAQLSATGANVGDVAKVMGVSVEALTKSLANGTVNAGKFGDALQDAIINKGKGPLERMAASSANLKKLLSEALGDLFEDIDVGPFMAEMKSLFDIFGQGNEAGKALKEIIGGFFKEFFALATKVVPYIRHFMLDLVIQAQLVYLKLIPIIKTFEKLWKQYNGLELLKKSLIAIGVILAVIAVAVLVAMVPFLLLTAVLVAIVVAIVAVGVAAQYAADYIATGLSSAFTAVSTFVTDAIAALGGFVTGAADVARDFIAGLVAGITNGAALVKDAVKGLATGAVSTITGAFGSHSPSTVMMGIGGDVTDGLSGGIDAGAGDVQASAGGLASATVKGVTDGAPGAAGKAGSSSSAGGKGDITVNVEPGAIVIQGGGQSAIELTEEAISMVFERVALGAGL